MGCCIYIHWWWRSLFIWQLPASFGAGCSSIQWCRVSRKEICLNKTRRMDQDQWQQGTQCWWSFFNGNDEDFTLNLNCNIIAPAEIEAIKIASRDIWFNKVIDHLLNNTVLGQQPFWAWQVTRMRSYMKYLVIMHHGYKPKYNDLCWQKGDIYTEIKASHIAYFYHGVMMAWIFSNNTLINNIKFVNEYLDTVSCGKAAITQDI